MKPNIAEPPRHLIDAVGGGSFKAIGEKWLETLITYGGVTAADHVLDVGCGVGRMAVPLTGYLEKGQYEGFDIMVEGVQWCQRHITPIFPHFHFTHAEIRSGFYNPNARTRARDFTFPYADELFDFTFATSVFTHMLWPDVEHYFQEIARTLKQGGRLLATFFLVGDEFVHRTESSRFSFAHPVDGSLVENPDSIEAAVAQDEERVRVGLSKAGMNVRQVIYGSWRGGPARHSQDVVVAQREG